MHLRFWSKTEKPHVRHLNFCCLFGSGLTVFCAKETKVGNTKNLPAPHRINRACDPDAPLLSNRPEIIWTF